jgi:hypothetical protein
LHRTIAVDSRLTLAMHANGIFTAEQLSDESGVALPVIRALLDGDASKLSAVDGLKLKDALRTFSLRWIILGDGDPSELFYRLTQEEADLMEGWRKLLHTARDRVLRTLKRYTR